LAVRTKRQIMGRQWQRRILIIDDDERALSVIRNFLVNEGFDVMTACGTQAAISSLQSGEHDLVLADDHFADLTSSCFLKQLVRIPGNAPVIVMESAPSWPCRVAPYNPLRSVNKWCPCEILEAVSEVLSNKSNQSAI
jgi:DNA-binding NtrC family response regulator